MGTALRHVTVSLVITGPRTGKAYERGIRETRQVWK